MKLISRNRFYVAEPECLVFTDIAWHVYSKTSGNDIERLAGNRLKRLRLFTILKIESDFYRQCESANELLKLKYGFGRWSFLKTNRNVFTSTGSHPHNPEVGESRHKKVQARGNSQVLQSAIVVRGSYMKEHPEAGDGTGALRAELKDITSPGRAGCDGGRPAGGPVFRMPQYSLPRDVLTACPYSLPGKVRLCRWVPVFRQRRQQRTSTT